MNNDIAPTTVSVGIGRFYPDVLELARSHFCLTQMIRGYKWINRTPGGVRQASRGGTPGDLEAYIKSNGSVRAATAAMHVHTNTMKYRQRRVEKVLGVEFRSHEVCFDLELALKLRRYVQLFA